MRRQNRRLLYWLWDDCPVLPGPDWLTDIWLDPLIDFVAWVGCKVRGHASYVEMDNRTVVCAYCHRIAREALDG